MSPNAEQLVVNNHDVTAIAAINHDVVNDMMQVLFGYLYTTSSSVRKYLTELDNSLGTGTRKQEKLHHVTSSII